MESQCDLVFESLNDVLLLGIKKNRTVFLSESQKKLRFIEQFSWKIYKNAWKTNIGAICPSFEKTRVYVQLMYQS